MRFLSLTLITNFDALPFVLKFLLFLIVILSEMPFASSQTTSSSPATQKPKEYALYAPPPKYPKDAKGRRPAGSGTVVMEIDEKTGWVKSAKMEKSTGNKLLDDAALQAFSQWRFKPGTVRHVRTPVTFGSRIRRRMAGAVISD